LEEKAMKRGSKRQRPVALTCPTCGGAVRQVTEGGSLRFTCHLGHSFAVTEMDEAQLRELERVLGTALRMFNERAELARRLAAMQRKRGRPVSAEHWEATTCEMNEAAEVLHRFMGRGWRRPAPQGDEDGDGGEPGAAQT
jgi:two-component system chemotaxis response regulator CheB